MLHLLRQPYPATESVTRQVRQGAVIGLFVGLFLLAFQPFGLSRWETPDKTLKVLGFGGITFVITVFNFVVWRQLFPRQFSEERWTVGREILLITANILLIAVANRLYLGWLLTGKGYTDVMGWVNTILITFLVGLFPTTGAVLANYVRRLRKYSQLAATLPVHEPPLVPDKPTRAAVAPTEPPAQPLLTLVADNEKDTLTVNPADLLYIESSDNYCTVVHWQAGKLVRPLLRSSLSRLVGQINGPGAGRTPFVRCHRSYVVNLDRVERISGNAQGYKLHLADGQLTVPVSRQYNDTLVAQLKGL